MTLKKSVLALNLIFLLSSCTFKNLSGRYTTAIDKKTLYFEYNEILFSGNNKFKFKKESDDIFDCKHGRGTYDITKNNLKLVFENNNSYSLKFENSKDKNENIRINVSLINPDSTTIFTDILLVNNNGFIEGFTLSNDQPQGEFYFSLNDKDYYSAKDSNIAQLKIITNRLGDRSTNYIVEENFNKTIIKHMYESIGKNIEQGKIIKGKISLFKKKIRINGITYKKIQ